MTTKAELRREPVERKRRVPRKTKKLQQRIIELLDEVREKGELIERMAIQHNLAAIDIMDRGEDSRD